MLFSALLFGLLPLFAAATGEHWISANEHYQCPLLTIPPFEAIPSTDKVVPRTNETELDGRSNWYSVNYYSNNACDAYVTTLGPFTESFGCYNYEVNWLPEGEYVYSANVADCYMGSGNCFCQFWENGDCTGAQAQSEEENWYLQPWGSSCGSNNGFQITSFNCSISYQ